MSQKWGLFLSYLPFLFSGFLFIPKWKGASGYFHAKQEDKIQYPHFSLGLLSEFLHTSVWIQVIQQKKKQYWGSANSVETEE